MIHSSDSAYKLHNAISLEVANYIELDLQKMSLYKNVQFGILLKLPVSWELTTPVLLTDINTFEKNKVLNTQSTCIIVS